MILKECYYVCYYTADFSKDGKSTNHEDFYLIYSNALMAAKELTKCLDVVDGNVSIVSALTGEVLAEFSADEAIIPTIEKAEEEAATTIGGTFKDKNGDTWYSAGNGKWKFDCTNRHCSDCPYYDEEYGCIVEEPLHEVDRNYQVALAHERMRVRAKETEKDSIPTFTDTFKDKNGNIWHLTDDGKWDYDCTGRNCSDCVYCDKGGCCEIVDPLCEEDRNYQIELAKERITEANKLATIDDSFEDGFGGVWCKNKDELWYYNCYGMLCNNCPYYSNYESCHTNNLSLDDAKKRITEAKERIGK